MTFAFTSIPTSNSLLSKDISTEYPPDVVCPSDPVDCPLTRTTLVTVPLMVSSPMASAVTVAFIPSSIFKISASSTVATIFKELVSSIVTSAVLESALTSPTETLTAVTTPPQGAVMLQSANCSFKSVSLSLDVESVVLYLSSSTASCASAIARFVVSRTFW